MIGCFKKCLIRVGAKRWLAARRLKLISRITGNDITCGKTYGRVLEVGCASGNDYVQFCKDDKNIEIVGIDVEDHGITQGNFTFIHSDAEKICYPDSYFDLVLSFGVLEHVQPIEKLAAIVREINRVSKSYVIVVPSVSTVVEPHTSSLFWQLRSRNKKKCHVNRSLNYYSDEAWLQFTGFDGAKTERFFHLPPFISNLVIYKLEE